MNTTSTSTNGSHSDIHVAFDISIGRFYDLPNMEGIRPTPTASRSQGVTYKLPWDIDPDSWYQTLRKGVACTYQVPSQLRDSSSTGTFWPAATTPVKMVK